MKQIARNLTDADDGFLNDKCCLLMDRDTKFFPTFRDFLDNEGTGPVILPPRTPNLNAHLERFHRGEVNDANLTAEHSHSVFSPVCTSSSDLCPPS